MKKKNYIYDLLLIGGLLLIGILSYMYMISGRNAGGAVVVRVNGQNVGVYDLYENGRYELNGGSNILIIDSGKAYLEDANCPDKLCVEQGKISLDGQVITCLPNKLTVTVYANNSEVELIS